MTKVLLVILAVVTAPVWIPLVMLVICYGVALILYLVELILVVCAAIWYFLSEVIEC